MYEPKCKVCRSKNREHYEEEWKQQYHKVPWMDFQREAKFTLGESISRKGFWRHFTLHCNTDEPPKILNQVVINLKPNLKVKVKIEDGKITIE